MKAFRFDPIGKDDLMGGQEQVDIGHLAQPMDGDDGMVVAQITGGNQHFGAVEQALRPETAQQQPVVGRDQQFGIGQALIRRPGQGDTKGRCPLVRKPDRLPLAGSTNTIKRRLWTGQRRCQRSFANYRHPSSFIACRT